MRLNLNHSILIERLLTFQICEYMDDRHQGSWSIKVRQCSCK